MKRSTRSRYSAVTTASLAAVMAMAPTAHAEEAASINIPEGSSEAPSVEGGNDVGNLLRAAVGLSKAVDNLTNEGTLPSIEQGADGGLKVVLDPSVLPGLAEALAPSTITQLSPSLRGTTVDGYQVVFPTSGVLTSGYGMRWGAMHNGIDIGNVEGTPIYSVMSGTVINSGPAQGFGNWIKIKHDNGAVSVYGHMSASSLLVNVGDRVEAGQQIAAIGNEGHSTGPHLHFEIHPDGTNPADPQLWFSQQGISM